MIAWVLLNAAFALSKWEGRDADVVAQVALTSPQEALYEILLDDRVLERILPEDCASDFDYEGVKDPKATVRLTYHAGAMHRRIDALHSRSDPPRLVEIEHLGSKGFFTRFTLTAQDDGTMAVMTTYLNPPPWPFRKYYYTQVRPIWVQCQIDALKALDAQASGS